MQILSIKTGLKSHRTTRCDIQIPFMCLKTSLMASQMSTFKAVIVLAPGSIPLLFVCSSGDWKVIFTDLTTDRIIISDHTGLSGTDSGLKGGGQMGVTSNTNNYATTDNL